MSRYRYLETLQPPGNDTWKLEKNYFREKLHEVLAKLKKYLGIKNIMLLSL